MIRGPDVAVGVPKAVAPMFAEQGMCARNPQTAVDVERENCVVRTPLMFARLSTLNASQMNWQAYALGDLHITRHARVQGTVVGR